MGRCVSPASGVASGRRTETLRVELGPQRYFVKRYWVRGRSPARLLRSKLRQEYDNLCRLKELEIATPPIVAWGERGGRRYRGALVTVEVPGAVDLAEIAQKHAPFLQSKPWRDEVIRQLADSVRRMHEVGFVHYDLKWRNVLVEPEAPRVFLIDCPEGRRVFGPFLRYGVLRDLYGLDKTASQILRRSDRLAFYYRYAGRSRLNARDKLAIRRIEDHRARRLRRLLP